MATTHPKIMQDTPIVEGYEIFEQCCVGAFSKVFRAKHLNTQEIVAIKKIEKLPKFASDSHHEFHMTNQVRHENVVEVKDQLVSDLDEIVMVMEYASGGDLYDFLESTTDSKMDMEMPCLMIQAARSLEACHVRGIVHGDVKLENFLLTHNHQLKLCDFGISGRSGEVRVGRPYGTTAYMAPELAAVRNRKARYTLHPSADVWSFGILLYACLFHDLPWDRALMKDSGYASFILNNGVAGWSYAKALSPQMANLLSRILEPDHKLRITMSEVISELVSMPSWWQPPQLEEPIVQAVQLTPRPPQSRYSTTTTSSPSKQSKDKIHLPPLIPQDDGLSFPAMPERLDCASGASTPDLSPTPSLSRRTSPNPTVSSPNPVFNRALSNSILQLKNNQLPDSPKQMTSPPRTIAAKLS